MAKGHLHMVFKANKIPIKTFSFFVKHLFEPNMEFFLNTFGIEYPGCLKRIMTSKIFTYSAIAWVLLSSKKSNMCFHKKTQFILLFWVKDKNTTTMLMLWAHIFVEFISRNDLRIFLWFFIPYFLLTTRLSFYLRWSIGGET